MLNLLAGFTLGTANAEDGAALFGTAAILGAVTPMVVAGAQSSADRYTAQLSAQTSMYNTDRFAGLAEYQAAMQSSTALALAGMQANLNSFNQGQTTSRLAMQLAAMDRAAEQNRQMNLYSLQMDYALKNRQLDFQAQIAAQQASLSRIASGGSPFTMVNSGDALGVQGYGIAARGGAQALNATSASDRLLSSVQTSLPSGTGFSSARGLSGVKSSLAVGSSRTRKFVSSGPVLAVSVPAVRRAIARTDWPRHLASTPAEAAAAPSAPVSSHHSH